MDAMKHVLMQKSIKDNAEELQCTVKDLYQWEKTMKNKEKQLKNLENERKVENNIPIRSHMEEYKHLAVSSEKIKPTLQNGNAEIISKKIPQEKELTAKEKAMFLKEKGNQFVKVGDHKNAIKEYTNAIMMFDKDAVFYTNRSLCYLKLESYDKCIVDCEKAISLDSKAVKAYFRRMQAYEKLELYQKALEDCLYVLKLEPKNIMTKKSLQEIQQKIAENDLLKTTKDENVYKLEITGPEFTKLSNDMIEIQAYNKKPHLRSKKPLTSITIEEVVNTENGTSFANNMKITDELIDEIFNGFDSHQPSFSDPKKQKLSKETNVNNEIKSSKSKLIASMTESSTKPVKETKLLDTNDSKTTADCKPLEPISSSVATSDSTATITAQKIIPAKTKTVLIEVTKPTDKNLNSVNDSVVPDKPTTTIEFYTNWRDLCTEKKYLYFKSIDMENITKMLGAEFSSDILSEIMEIFSKYYIPNKCPVGRTLFNICKHPEIGILSMLLSNDEKCVIADIIKNIELYENDFEHIDYIKNVFSI